MTEPRKPKPGVKTEYQLRDRKTRRWRTVDLDVGRFIRIRVKRHRGRKWVTLYAGRITGARIEQSLARGSSALLALEFEDPFTAWRA